MAEWGDCQSWGERQIRDMEGVSYPKSGDGASWVLDSPVSGQRTSRSCTGPPSTHIKGLLIIL